MTVRNLRLMHRRECGFTLIEVLIAMGIGGLLVGAIAMTIFQVLVNPTLSSNHMTAVKQVENAIHWMSRDARMSQILEPSEGSGFPLKLTWVEWEDNTVNEVTYNVEENGDLRRSHSADGVELSGGVVAQHIDSNSEVTRVQLGDDGTLILEITSTITGFRTSSETRVVEIMPRPGA